MSAQQFCDPETHQTKKEKKHAQPWIEAMICQLPPGVAFHDVPQHGLVHFVDGEMDLALAFEIRQIKTKRTEREKRETRRLYTKEYVKRPQVQAKIQARLNDPQKVKARQEYAKQPEVKNRKRQLNKRNREIRALLKEEKPEIYNELLGKVSERVQV